MKPTTARHLPPAMLSAKLANQARWSKVRGTAPQWGTAPSHHHYHGDNDTIREQKCGSRKTQRHFGRARG